MKVRTIKELEELSAEEIREAKSEIQLLPRIDSHLDDLNLENSRSLYVFSASDIGSTTGHSLCGKYPMGCGRMLYYRYIGEEPVQRTKPRNRRIFDTGTQIHIQLQAYLNEIARRSNEEYDFNDEVGISPKTSQEANRLEIVSTTDGIFEIKLGNQIRFGLEIKSIKTELFDKLNGPKPEHIVQSTLYMACLDLPLMNILYYNKNTSSILEFPLVFDPEIWKAISKKILFVRMAAIENSPPPRECSMFCYECRYFHICKPNPRGKKTIIEGFRRKRK